MAIRAFGIPRWRAVAYSVFFLIVILGVVYATWMPGRSYTGPLDSLSDEELTIRDKLKSHVYTLASTIGERNLQRYPGLTQAAQYVSQTFRDAGYDVHEQTYAVEGKPVKNFEIELPGQSRRKEIVVVGAHYDSLVGTPGADDNATGAAAVLELARLAAHQRYDRTVRFVAFVNEEPPYFHSPDMGSWVYARAMKQRGERVSAMLSLEMFGCYSDESGSQHYPAAFRFFCPRTGNFIAFVGNLGSHHLVRETIGSFRKYARFPSMGAAAPGFMPGIGWSDQWSFWQEGYPAVMVTDTALFRNPQYHMPGDTPERVDYERMTRVVSGLEQVIADLAGRPGG